MLSRSPEAEVVGEAEGGKEALKLTKDLDPDVMLLDVEMPDMKGYEVARHLAESGCSTRVLALSGYDEKRYILGMFTSGAVGYLTKDEAPEHLIHAVEDIAAGRKGWISPRIAKRLGIPPHPVGRDTIPALSPLEMKVLGCLTEGRTNKEIASILEITPFALKETIQSITSKLGVKSSLEAVLRAMQEGLV